MFYRPETGHPLRHNPFKAIVAPRPIGWISTRCSRGDNLAPYSFFNAVADEPEQVMFAGGHKDSIRAIEETGVFAVNIVEAAALHAMNETSRAHPAEPMSSSPPGWPRRLAKPSPARALPMPLPRWNAARPGADIPGIGNLMVIGTVTGVHLRPDCVVDTVRRNRFRPLSRLGYRDYATVDAVFALNRPDD